MNAAVLIVEDNPDDVFLLRRAFAKCYPEVKIDVVGDGESAIAYLAQRPKNNGPQLMLLDLKLPRVSGFEVLQWRQSHAPSKQFPAVVLTSSAEDKDLERAYGAGANSYLCKPATPEGLLDLTQRIGAYWLQTNRLQGIERHFARP